MNMKKLFSLIMALLMAFSMVAVAEEEEDKQDLVVQPRAVTGYTVTVNDSKPGRTYTAYQIFAGTLATVDGKPTLGEIVWGSGVNAEALMEAIKTDARVTAFKDCTTAAEVAEKLSTYGDDAPEVVNFADFIADHINDEGTVSAGNGTTYTIGNLPAGYYLIQETTTLTGDMVASRYILKVVEDVQVAPKRTEPEIDKSIVEDGEDVEANEDSIGGTVNYKIETEVPDMTGYNKYFFIIHDTLSVGLTFNGADSVAITIDGETVPAANYEVRTEGLDDGCTFEIIFKNFKTNYAEKAGKAVVITYSATINQDAEIGNTGNPNAAKLEYSNNPNHEYKGENEPGEGDVTGETPEDVTVTYVTGIKLIKKDNKDQILTGAKFTITGTSKKVVIVNEEIFKVDTNGTYYRLKDGTYTETAPTVGGDNDNTELYDDTTTKYTKVTVISAVNASEPFEATGWVKTDGSLTFVGLGAGEYEIEEIVAPNGYNILTEKIKVKIECTNIDELKAKENIEKTTQCAWKVTVDGKEITAVDNLFTFDVVNQKGSNLPSTGGMGTTMLYVGGGILMMAAFVLIVSKRRATAE